MKLGELQKLMKAVPQFQSPDAQEQIRSFLRSIGLDPNALYQELEMTSRFVDTHRDTTFSNAQIQLHSHAFYELIYCCTSGRAEYLVGSERYRLQPGDIIFVPPGISHRPLLPEDTSEPYTRYVLWLSQSFLEELAAVFPHPFRDRQYEVGMLRTAGTRWEKLGELFKNGIEEATERADGWEAALIGNTLILLAQIRRATVDRSVGTLSVEKPELLDELTAFVEENYHRHFTIEDIARQLYISSSTVSHLFKQKMGVSLYRYVTQRRLIAAKALIEKGIPLDEVCLQVGFADYSGFYRAFKQEYGIPPRQYRNLTAADR